MNCLKNKLHNLEAALAYIIFNRPVHTQKSFAYLKHLKPRKLYVIADGPRNEVEKILTDACRSIIGQIDWECDLHTNYSDTNLGCKQRVSTGISWVFAQEEKAIFLEDDCIPGKSFVVFCNTMLDRYSNDENVMHIGANNFQFGKKAGDGDYYFSNYAHIWGWASWRRAWKHYNADIPEWPQLKQNRALDKVFDGDSIQLEYWKNTLDKMYNKEIDTWDYQWLLAIWKTGGKCIIPEVNLVENIGFDEAATHTRQESKQVNILKAASLYSVNAPSNENIKHEADAKFFYRWFGIQKPSSVTLLSKIKNKAHVIRQKFGFVRP